jgi:hypothetical protein
VNVDLPRSNYLPSFSEEPSNNEKMPLGSVYLSRMPDIADYMPSPNIKSAKIIVQKIANRSRS